MRIFLDMDGVVADFDRKFFSISGYEVPNFIKFYGKDRFWNLIDNHGVTFWSQMPLMPLAKEFVEAYKYRPITFLTALPKTGYGMCMEGKRQWLDQHFPGFPVRFVHGAKNKAKHVESYRDILIDDREDTIERWNKAGGEGILFHNFVQTTKALEGYLAYYGA